MKFELNSVVYTICAALISLNGGIGMFFVSKTIDIDKRLAVIESTMVDIKVDRTVFYQEFGHVLREGK